MSLREPTSDECSGRRVVEIDGQKYMATYYPQMGGYVGKCWVELRAPEQSYVQALDCHETHLPCFDVWIWHDGEFPFSDDGENRRSPAHLHHCTAEQFIRFGQEVRAAQEALGKRTS